jgi:hypothetical protein
MKNGENEHKNNRDKNVREVGLSVDEDDSGSSTFLRLGRLKQ